MLPKFFFATATAAVLSVTGAMAQQVDCEEVVALATSASAMVKTISAMSEICKDRIKTDPTCRDYADIIKANALGENMLAFSTQSLALAMKCPD